MIKYEVEECRSRADALSDRLEHGKRPKRRCATGRAEERMGCNSRHVARDRVTMIPASHWRTSHGQTDGRADTEIYKGRTGWVA